MNTKKWFVVGGGTEKGPFTGNEIITKLQSKELNPFFYARTDGTEDRVISQIPEFANWKTATVQNTLTKDPVNNTQRNSTQNTMQGYTGYQAQSSTPTNSHEIDYRVVGEEMQYVEIELDPNEAVVAEAGAMMYMADNIKMDTIFGDGSQKSESQNLFGRILGAGSRIITGESLFMTAFSNIGSGKKRVAFASPYPGKIIPVDLNLFNGKLICQKDAFLCAAKGVSVGIEFNKKISVGFFGGEGFIMQKLEGDGMAFIHASGTISEFKLSPGEVLKVDTGCLVAFTKDINYDIEMVKGIKSMFFGGEGICFAKVTGPGSVWVQSLPFSRLASRILAGATGPRKGEGTSLLGGLGNLLDGD